MESFARMMANNVGPDKAANREEATDVGSNQPMMLYIEVPYGRPSELSRSSPPIDVLSLVRIPAARGNRCYIRGIEWYAPILKP